MPRPSIKLPSHVPTTSVTSPEEPGTIAGRRERKQQKTRDQICQVAWDMFEAQGFDVVTMEAIAEAADVAKGTLYKHFPVKEALIQHRFEQDMFAQRDAIGAAVFAMPTCAERLARLFHEEAVYLEKMRPYLGPYLRYRLDSRQVIRRLDAPSPFERAISGILHMGQAAGEINTEMPAERMAEYMTFLRLATLLRWLVAPGASLGAIHEEMIGLFLNGVSCKVQS